MSKLNNNVLIIASDLAIESNYNADMTGYPQQDATGNYTVSSHSIKYMQKMYYSLLGKKVFMMESYKEDKDLAPRDIKERYEFLFGKNSGKDKLNVLKDIFTCEDIIQNGAVVAIKKANVGVRGAAQTTEGFNIQPETHYISKDVKSCFRNGENKNATQTTLGVRHLLDIARFVHSTCIYPNTYKEYEELKGLDFEGYTEENLENLKNATIYGPSLTKSSAKNDIKNELTIVIKVKEGIAVDPMHRLVRFVPDDEDDFHGTYVLDLSKAFITKDIDLIEVYYDENTCKVDLNLPVDLEKEKINYYNVRTKGKIVHEQ